MQRSNQKIKLDKELLELQSENTYLKAQQDKILSLAVVEQKAINELGMMKMDKSQIEYVDLSSPDKVEIAHTSVNMSNIFSKLATSLSALLEYIK